MVSPLENTTQVIFLGFGTMGVFAFLRNVRANDLMQWTYCNFSINQSYQFSRVIWINIIINPNIMHIFLLKVWVYFIYFRFLAVCWHIP